MKSQQLGSLWMLVAGLFFAVMGATIAQLAMTRAYRTGSPLVVGSLAYTTVVLASLFGILLWNETLSPDHWLAVALIILSGVISVRATPR